MDGERRKYEVRFENVWTIERGKLISGHCGLAAIPMCITSLESWWLLKAAELELNHSRPMRIVAFYTTHTHIHHDPLNCSWLLPKHTTQHAKYKWCVNAPLCGRPTPHIHCNQTTKEEPLHRTYRSFPPNYIWFFNCFPSGFFEPWWYWAIKPPFTL